MSKDTFVSTQRNPKTRSVLTEWWTLHGHWVHHWHWSHLGHHLGNHLGNNLGFCKESVVFLLTCFCLAILLMNISYLYQVLSMGKKKIMKLLVSGRWNNVCMRM